MTDLSKRTARELLTTRVSDLLNTDYGVFSIRSYLPARLASLIDAVIGRDERLTEKLKIVRERLIQRNSQGVRFEVEELNEIIGEEPRAQRNQSGGRNDTRRSD